jgi:hypothetical protein
LLVDYLEKGATIIGEYYIALLNKMNQQLVSSIEASFGKEYCFFKIMLFLIR